MNTIYIRLTTNYFIINYLQEKNDTFDKIAIVAISIKCRQQNGREYSHQLACLEYTLKQHKFWFFGRPFVKRFAPCYQTVVCPICLTVCNIGVWCIVAKQLNGSRRIKMKLGMQVGLGPGHVVLDGYPAPPPQRGTEPPIFGPHLLRPNGRRYQDASWYGGRTRPRGLCVRWGPRFPCPVW